MQRRILAALAASTLIVALSAPAALGQAIFDDSDETNVDVQYVDCSQVQAAVAAQGQYGDADAVADDESEATAEIAQELNITQKQVNECLGGDADRTPKPDDDRNDDRKPPPLADGKDAVIDRTVKAAKLPETGGPSLLALAAGAALVVGGAALIRRR